MVLALLLAVGATADADTPPGIIRSSKGPSVAIPTEVRFVSTAPRSSPTHARRISLHVYEVYYSLAIDEIVFGASEEEPDRIFASHFFSGFDIAPRIGRSRLTALELVRWVGPREFELREQDLVFRIRYEGDGAISIEGKP